MTVCSPSDQQASQTGQRLGWTLSHEERKGSEVNTERVAVTPDTAIEEHHDSPEVPKGYAVYAYIP